MMLLGFCGRAGHGKTTACDGIRDYARNKLELDARIFSISDLVIEFCKEHGKLSAGKTREALTAEELVTLIEVGREQRAVRKTYWIELLENQINNAAPDVALVPNLRYANETRWLRDSGGTVVKCTCLNDYGSLYISPNRPANDPSEAWADNMTADHYIVVKSGHGALVEQQAITLFEYLRGLHEDR